MAATLKVVPTSPDWKFDVQAVKTTSGKKVVAVLVTAGIPLALLSAAEARKIARALDKAANKVAGTGSGSGGALVDLPDFNL
jgi:hypothetical protein